MDYQKVWITKPTDLNKALAKEAEIKLKRAELTRRHRLTQYHKEQQEVQVITALILTVISCISILAYDFITF